jgi:hypothetical protein
VTEREALVWLASKFERMSSFDTGIPVLVCFQAIEEDEWVKNITNALTPCSENTKGEHSNAESNS